jgi:OmpA-OmpF porin, OOP family
MDAEVGTCGCSGRERGRLVALAVVAAVIGTSAPAWGQVRFDVQRFNPTVSQRMGFFVQPSGRVTEAGRWELGLLLNYADDPLVLADIDDNRVGSPVAAQLTANLLFVWGFGNLFDLGVDLPIVLYQAGDALPLLRSAQATDPGAGLGDLRLVPRLMLFGPRSMRVLEGPALGLLVDTRLPTGRREDYQGEGFRVEPKLAFDHGFAGGYRVGAALGYMFRTSPGEIANVEAGSGLTWSVAGVVPVLPEARVVAELGGSVLLGADDHGTEESPLEALLGLRYDLSRSLMVQGGAGLGLVRGIGTPDFRLFAGLVFSPEGPPDRDLDGVVDAEDACPELYGEQPDGCPEPDRDGDGVCDRWVTEAGMERYFADKCLGVDICPDVYGERADGCPDPDQDGDRVCDPWVAEQGLLAHFAEVCRGVDRCPEEYGEAEDGCPLEIRVTCTAIEISDRIHFAVNSDVIESVSFGLLNALAQVLIETPEIRGLRIEGHTDNTASAGYNLALSQRRAASVRQYLIERGVASERLEAQGFGLTRPIADNSTEEGRAQNRRVEFVITEQDDCREQIVP